MIRLILTGGLGNQMFEYAASKALSERLHEELTIDLYALNKQTKGTKRQLELDIFDIDLNISSSWKSKFLIKAFPLVEKNKKLFYRLFGYFRDNSAIVFCPEFEQLKGNIILHGHFQNELYFKKQEQIIRREFQFPELTDKKNIAIANKIKNSESISIHIRRGDYLSNEQAKNNFAVCDKDYYTRVIDEINQQVNAPHFFVFSEDFDWIKENINFGDKLVEYIDWNKGKNSYIDMQLMSLCKHNIIANSSFSWWGAWLNTNENKLVYAPSKWFREEVRNKDLVNFYPSSWRII